MKKIIIGLLIIVVLGIGIFLILKSPDWKTYENTRYKFSVDYPSNWDLGETETNNAGQTFTDPKTGVECYAYGFANALKNEKGEPQSLKEFIDWLVVDPRVGEGLYTDVIDRTNTTLDEHNALYLLMEKDTNIWDAVYALGPEEGRGLYCIYKNMEEREQYKDVFKKMQLSFKMNKFLYSEENQILCSNYLNGVLTPLKTEQFTDNKYTGVTMTNRNYWDKNRLPKNVLKFENLGYICTPMPLEFKDSEEKNKVIAEPMVTKVQWNCELEYNDWKYLNENDSAGKQDAEKAGFICEKEKCFADGSIKKEATVWFCSK